MCKDIIFKINHAPVSSPYDLNANNSPIEVHAETDDGSAVTFSLAPTTRFSGSMGPVKSDVDLNHCTLTYPLQHNSVKMDATLTAVSGSTSRSMRIVSTSTPATL